MAAIACPDEKPGAGSEFLAAVVLYALVGMPFGWYRAMDRNWQLTSFAQGKKIEVPAMFMVGEVDPVRNYCGPAEADLPNWCADLRSQTVVKGAGHWLQQERPDEVNAGLLAFLRGL